MKTSDKLLLVTLVALVTLGCGLTINVPVDRISTGPTQTADIQVPLPEAKEVELNLSFGAGKLVLDPGAEGYLVDGTATFNVEDFRPKITVQDNRIEIETGNLEINGMPRFSDEVENTWKLKLAAVPMSLILSAGAYQGDLELGGLPLKALEVTDGAADVRLNFSQPNPVEMTTFRYTTGASNVTLKGLANANFAAMIFRSGAGNYLLDFSGVLHRDATVTLESGVSKVRIIVPVGTAARIFFKGGLSNVSVAGSWKRSGDQYLLEGSGPTLTINVDMGAGSLELDTTD